MKSFMWESLDMADKNDELLPIVERAKVPGGWFVYCRVRGRSPQAFTFYYPDPKHEWDGGTLPAEEKGDA